jgi:Kef-type K+ transport system membrane component KefB
MKVFRLLGYFLCLLLVSSQAVPVTDASSEALDAIEEFLSEKPPLVLHNEEASGTTEHMEESESELSVEVSYEDIYQTLAFLAFIFAFGKLATLIGMPSLVGEIICGFLFGPPLADFVPFPKAIVLIGEIGLILLLLEAGIDVDIAQLKETGARSVAIACTGSVLPLLVGIGIAKASGSSLESSGMSWRSAIAVGACFSPTSLGVASNALSSERMLNTPVGQLIVAACVLDDIIGLIILSVIEVLNKEDVDVIQYFIPVISAFGFLLVLGYFALTWIPKVIEFRILPLFSESQRDLAAFTMMLLLLMGYLPLLYYTKASYLTGAFLAGLSFSQIHSVHTTFVHQTHRLMKWLLRIFFAASIGFQVPIKTFWTGNILGWGSLLYLCVLAKLPLGLYSPHFNRDVPIDYPFNPWARDSLVTGFAMTCRGEFSFIIAAFSLGQGIIGEDTYSAVIWAILLSCITSPYILLFVIKYFNKLSMESLQNTKTSGEVPLHMVIQCRCKISWGLQDKLSKCIQTMGLSEIDHRSWHPRGTDAIVVTEIYVQDTSTMIVLHNQFSDDNDFVITQENNIQARCAAVNRAITSTIAQIGANVQVTQWLPNVLAVDDKDMENISQHIEAEAKSRLDRDEEIGKLLEETPTTREPDQKRKRVKMVSVPVDTLRTDKVKSVEEQAIQGIVEEPEVLESIEESMDQPTELATPSGPRRRRPRHRTLSVPAFAAGNMWDQPSETEIQNLAMKSSFVPVVTYDLSVPSYGAANRRRQVSDLSALFEHSEMLPTVEEQLEGFVRHSLDDENNKKK